MTDSLTDAALGTVAARWGADRAATAMYDEHYRSLVRLAALLVDDVATAEEVVQESFAAMLSSWPRLRDSEKALPYLHRCVVNRSRSALRYRVVATRNAATTGPDTPSAGEGAPERPAVAAALRSLPPRQREALVLRYYADLPEPRIAAAMGISTGSVHRHTARAVAALRGVLEMKP